MTYRSDSSNGDDAGPGRGLVVVTDDQDDVRLVVVRLLQHLGFSVKEAVSGCEALDIMKTCGDAVCLVMLDWNMPGMDGRETLIRLQEEGFRTPVLVMSGCSESGLNAGEMPPILRGFIEKPFTLNDLKAKLNTVLCGIEPA